MMENKKEPVIRFKGFTNDWEQYKISSMIKDIADGPFGSNLKTEHYTNEKEARIIQLSNLSDNGWQEENTRYTTFEHAKEIKRCIVNEGELVMGKMMPAGMTIMRPNTEKMYVLSSDCVRIKLDESKINNWFFLYSTKSAPFLAQINNDLQGSTRVRTSISKIRNMDLSVSSKVEQEKIGNWFLYIDKLISFYQHKYEKLTDVKKSMLENMLPQNSSKKPLIRFKGFTDEWKQYKLGEMQESGILQLKRGNIIPKQNGHYPVYSSSAIGNGLFCTANSYMFDEEKVTWSVDGGGRVFYRPKHKFSVTNVCGYVDIISDSLDCKYLSIAMEKAWSQTTFDYVVKAHPSVISELYDIQVPCFEEQKAIGNIFKKLDNLIDLHQRKLEKLNNIKESMLKKMFV